MTFIGYITQSIDRISIRVLRRRILRSLQQWHAANPHATNRRVDYPALGGTIKVITEKRSGEAYIVSITDPLATTREYIVTPLGIDGNAIRREVPGFGLDPNSSVRHPFRPQLPDLLNLRQLIS